MALTYVEQTTPGSANDWFLNELIWCPGINIFVGVGRIGNANHNVITSPDGITWTFQTVPTLANWQSVAYAPAASGLGSGSGRIVAVQGAQTNGVMYSDNAGVTWTNANAAANVSWRGVTWSPTLGIFCAVASTGTTSTNVMTSSDGITWTSQTSASSTKTWSCVHWDDGRFIAVGNTRSTQSVMTSTNGTSWSLQTTPISVNAAIGQGSSISYSADLGMWAFTFEESGSQFGVLTSTNHGVTWVNQTMPAAITSGEGLWGIQWSHELTTWLVMSDYPGVITSPDGVTWSFTDLTSLDPVVSWTQNAYSSSLQIFVGGFSSSVHMLYVSAPAPTILPTSGHRRGGTAAVITGSGFTNTALVNVGGIIVTPTFVSSSQLDLTMPPHAVGLVTVTVYEPSTLQVYASLTFTYVTIIVTSVSPNNGPMAGSTPVTVTGQNFEFGDLIFFDGILATSIVFVSATSMTCVTPAHVAGAVTVTVATP